MMSCGVALERLNINEADMLLTATELKDQSRHVSEPDTKPQTCDRNEVLDLQTECNSVETDTGRTQNKQDQKIQQDMSSGEDCNVATTTANLRLTLKKVKIENSDKEEDTCLYVCHTKKLNTSKKVLVKCADRSSNTQHKTTRATKDSDGLTHSEKVII